MVLLHFKKYMKYLKALHANNSNIALLFVAYQSGQYSGISCDRHFYWTSRVVLVTLCLDDPVTHIGVNPHTHRLMIALCVPSLLTHCLAYQFDHALAYIVYLILLLSSYEWKYCVTVIGAIKFDAVYRHTYAAK